MVEGVGRSDGGRGMSRGVGAGVDSAGGAAVNGTVHALGLTMT